MDNPFVKEIHNLFTSQKFKERSEDMILFKTLRKEEVYQNGNSPFGFHWQEMREPESGKGQSSLEKKNSFKM